MRRQTGRCFSGPWNNHKFDQTRQLRRITPLGKQRDVVRADKIKQLRIGKTGHVSANRIDGIRSATALDLLIIDGVIGVPGQREPQKAEAFCRWRRL